MGDRLNIEIPKSENADQVKIDATKVFTRGQTTIWDNDLSDGVFASFNVPTGLYKIMMTSYKDGEQLSSEMVSRFFYINR